MTDAQETVAVVTDSAASLPENEVRDLGIQVVPMTIAIGDDVYPDGGPRPVEVVEKAARRRVTTSAPSPGAYLQTLEALGGRPVVIATVARRMSASFQSAVTAAAYGEAGRVDVVDTGTAAGGQGLVVMAAARAARSGSSLEEVTRVARHVAARVRLIAFLDQLDYLAGSGRVPGIVARAGRSLGVHAMFEFARGHVLRRRPARTVGGAMVRIVAACRADAHPGARLRAAVLESGEPRAAEALSALVHELAPDAELYVAPLSSVVLAHTGPGLTGLAWWWETEPQPRDAARR